jgi:hypothetical protein
MTDLLAITHLLPMLKPCQQIAIPEGAVLIQAPGFEDRTDAIFDLLTPDISGRVILLDYFPKDARNTLQRFKDQLSRRGYYVPDQDIIPYHRFNPATYEADLSTAIRRTHTTAVMLDISSMSKLAIILSLKVCADLSLPVTIYYTEALRYAPSLDDFTSARDRNEIHRPSLQIYNGIHGVVRTPSLSSVAMQGQPTAAIVFMSFNDALTQVLLNTIYPSRLFLINSRPPVMTWREEATAWIHDEVRKEWPEDNPVHATTRELLRVVSTLDYMETIQMLVDMFWQLSPEYRLVLAPAGSKMQTVGCFLVKRLHPDVHIEYPSPEGFSPEYSDGVGPTWSLNLGDIDMLVKALAQFERDAYLKLS